MNPVTTALTLNMQLPNIAAVSWAVQGDQLSRQIQATLVDGSTAWNPQVGYHGVVRFHKPDGTSGVYDVDEDGNPAVTWTGNVATVKIVQQALTVAGTVLMQLEFYDANEARVTAFGWANNVQPSAVTDNEFLSSDYYNILTLQIAGVLGADGHPPDTNATSKNWRIWDIGVGDYVDSGYTAVGEDGEQGPVGPVGPPGIAVQATAPTSNVLAWLDTDEDSTITIPEYSDLTAIENTLNQKAAKVDLTNISQTSPNCTVTNGIAKGTYFYLDGNLVRAINDIGNGVPFTSSNYETVPGGGLNDLNTIKGTKIFKTGTTSFSTLGIGFLGNALDRIASSISTSNTGFYSVQSGGPIYHVILCKYSDSYYSGYVTTYSNVESFYSARFTYQDGTYSVYIIT